MILICLYYKTNMSIVFYCFMWCPLLHETKKERNIKHFFLLNFLNIKKLEAVNIEWNVIRNTNSID